VVILPFITTIMPLSKTIVIPSHTIPNNVTRPGFNTLGAFFLVLIAALPPLLLPLLLEEANLEVGPVLGSHFGSFVIPFSL